MTKMESLLTPIFSFAGENVMLCLESAKSAEKSLMKSLFARVDGGARISINIESSMLFF